MTQGGDPSGTGNGESSFGKPFKDEFHSRLIFSHRGIVAMPNKSQFFITLSECDWLYRKHTIFGKITGNTIYNILKFNQIDTDKNTDRPRMTAPKILNCKILLSAFDDIIPRENIKELKLKSKSKKSKSEKNKDKKAEKLRKKEDKRKKSWKKMYVNVCFMCCMYCT